MSFLDENKSPQNDHVSVLMASVTIGIGTIFCVCSFPLLLFLEEITPNSIWAEVCFGSISLISGGYGLYRLRTSREISASVWGTFSGLLVGILSIIVIRIN